MLTVWVCNFFGKRKSAKKLLIKWWWNWLQPDDNGTYFTCLSSLYDPESSNLTTYPTDCWEKRGIVCRKFLYIQPVCTATTKFVKQNTFDLSLDPKKQDDKKKAILQKKLDFRDMMKRLDQTNSFHALFSNLWYATLPCFDVKVSISQTFYARLFGTKMFWAAFI